MLNILIRTCGRADLFARCLASVTSQNYPSIRVIVSIDRDVSYVPDWCEVIGVTPRPELEYGYDLYCNDLKAAVTDGHYLYVDDDDVLTPDCLSELDLSHPAIICQLDYMGDILPKGRNLNLIGMPCLILHHTLKDMVDFDGGDHGDLRYIKEVASKVELDFQEVVVVRVDRKGNGSPASPVHPCGIA